MSDASPKRPPGRPPKTEPHYQHLRITLPPDLIAYAKSTGNASRCIAELLQRKKEENVP